MSEKPLCVGDVGYVAANLDSIAKRKLEYLSAPLPGSLIHDRPPSMAAVYMRIHEIKRTHEALMASMGPCPPWYRPFRRRGWLAERHRFVELSVSVAEEIVMPYLDSSMIGAYLTFVRPLREDVTS